MTATEQVFVYNFGSSRARYSNFVSIPPEIDIPDTPDPSILRQSNKYPFVVFRVDYMGQMSSQWFKINI